MNPIITGLLIISFGALLGWYLERGAPPSPHDSRVEELTAQIWNREEIKEPH